MWWGEGGGKGGDLIVCVCCDSSCSGVVFDHIFCCSNFRFVYFLLAKGCLFVSVSVHTRPKFFFLPRENHADEYRPPSTGPRRISLRFRFWFASCRNFYELCSRALTGRDDILFVSVFFLLFKLVNLGTRGVATFDVHFPFGESSRCRLPFALA